MNLSTEDLRRLEREDEEARQGDNDWNKETSSSLHRLTDGRTILAYEAYLDYDGLLIEQDKSLGKGGLCWDAAFVLADYLSSPDTSLLINQKWKNKSTEEKETNVIELGAGTGVCGLLLAKQIPGLNVALTDLPALQSLLFRNSDRFLHGQGNDTNLIQYLESKGTIEETAKPKSMVEVYPLDWADTEGSHGVFDVVIGADVVATLYDPLALALTIQRLCHDKTVVYVSFKERLSTIHRQFEQNMMNLFSNVQIIEKKENGQTLSRNRNPDVRILTATQKFMID